jgi:hypothetical protein
MNVQGKDDCGETNRKGARWYPEHDLAGDSRREVPPSSVFEPRDLRDPPELVA